MEVEEGRTAVLDILEMRQKSTTIMMMPFPKIEPDMRQCLDNQKAIMHALTFILMSSSDTKGNKNGT